MNKKNALRKYILIGLLVISLALAIFPMTIPTPVQANSLKPMYPCYGYVCINYLQDPRVIACGYQGMGNAWFCNNYCYIGNQWVCQGGSGCQWGC